MGESITEGTLTKWLKKVGDKVERDEPLFEISTDKVDAEIPSPAAGTLQEIKITEGATVQINTVVCIIAENAGAEVTPAFAPAPTATAATPPPVATAPATPAPAAIVAGTGTDVPMPQMGESITEGTITKWLKKVGDTIERDEPLFEISTDKVDAEIPSPVAGTLTEIKFPEGTTVGINTIVAVIGGVTGKPAATPAPAAAAPAPPAPATVTPVASAAPVASTASGERPRSSPLVRKIAKDNSIDLAQVPATGPSGRITKTDILGYIENPAAMPAHAAASPAMAAAASPAAAARLSHLMCGKIAHPSPPASPSRPPGAMASRCQLASPQSESSNNTFPCQAVVPKTRHTRQPSLSGQACKYPGP